MKFPFSLVLITAGFLLSACGGGGSSDSSTPVTIPPPPVPPTVAVSADIKSLIFTWNQTEGSDYYRLLQKLDDDSAFSQVGENISGEILEARIDLSVHLFDFNNAQFVVEGCHAYSCSTSAVVTVADLMLDTIGFFSQSIAEPVNCYFPNPPCQGMFGLDTALSGDGTTLAIGMAADNSNAVGINGGQTDLSLYEAGAVYLFRKHDHEWVQEAYIKPSNTGAGDRFGWSVTLSADGNVLAVGAPHESSASNGMDGDQSNDDIDYAGAVYVFRFDGVEWAQEAYIKGSNNNIDLDTYGDEFGASLALSPDGSTLAVGARGDASAATGIDGDMQDHSLPYSGAAYLYTFDETSWSFEAYVKPSNTGGFSFGNSVSLNEDGSVLAVGASYEASYALGINGDQAQATESNSSGAVYVFRKITSGWVQEAYIKPSIRVTLQPSGTPDFQQLFGDTVSISWDGNVLAVSAPREDAPPGRQDAGAIYVFKYDGTAWYEDFHLTNEDTHQNYNGWSRLLGEDIALSGDGRFLAVGKRMDGSADVGVGADPHLLCWHEDLADFAYCEEDTGAVYLYEFDGTQWILRQYIKASTEDAELLGRTGLSIDKEGKTIAVRGFNHRYGIYLY